MAIVGEPFLERHFIESERESDGILDLIPSIGLIGESSSRRLLARGLAEKSLSKESTGKSPA